MSWGDVKDIKFQNEIFTDPLCLRWDIEGTKKKEQKSAGTSAKEIRNILIYGRNGSGKTSISRAIAHMGMMDGTSVCRLYGGSGEQIPLNDALKENVFVEASCIRHGGQVRSSSINCRTNGCGRKFSAIRIRLVRVFVRDGDARNRGRGTEHGIWLRYS